MVLLRATPSVRAMFRALVPSPASRSVCLNCLMVIFRFAGIALSLFSTRSVCRSCRKVGGLLIGIRAHSGMVAAFKSEYPAGLIRNPHSTFAKSFETEI
ncbi:hypothetical protein [Mesorhizobium sp. M0408]|uniref:hypothetical protein n=1 Tax=Mesorhizobium sp. M0408 TaxID=2956942 RepID=UPI0033370F89